MALLIALAFIALVVFVVSKLKPGTPEDAPFADVADDDAGGFDEQPVEPPGEPSEWVTLRTFVPRAEAPVIKALVESNGIKMLMEPDFRGGIVYESPADAPSYRLRVKAEDVDAARALLDGEC